MYSAESWKYTCNKFNISLRYFGACLLLELQDKNPRNIGFFLPINICVFKLKHSDQEVFDENYTLLICPRKEPLDLPHYFEPSCGICMNNFSQSIREFHYAHEPKINTKTFAHIFSIKNGINDDMKDFAVSEHPLDSNFSLGKLNAFRIDIMNSNGYVRANSIRENDMNLVGKSKELNKWYKTKATQELIQAYAEDLKVSAEDLTIDVKSTHNNLRGVYLHPDLVIDYASWISPKFKILTQRILKDHFRSESKRAIMALNAQMQVKDEKIDRLEQRVIDLQKSVSDSNATINRINDTLEPLRSYREKSLTFIENSVERISCPVPENLQHRFIISAVRSNIKKDYDYVITRIQKRNKNGTLQSKAQDLGVELITVYEVQSPNPINLSHAVSKIDGVQRCGQFIKTSIVQQHFLLAVDAIVKRDLNDYKIIKSNI